MSTLRKAAHQALEALEYDGLLKKRQAITALRAALAQQKDPTDPGRDVDVLREHVRHLERRVRQLHAQQAEPVEPVAGVVLNEEGRAALVEHGREEWHCVSRNARRLYTAPPQRKPLTKEQFLYIYNQLPNWGMDMDSLPQGLEKFGRAIERAHGIGETK